SGGSGGPDLPHAATVPPATDTRAIQQNTPALWQRRGRGGDGLGTDDRQSKTPHRMYRDKSSFFTISASILLTYPSSMVTFFSSRSGPSNEISSRSFSITVWRRRAPMF